MPWSSFSECWALGLLFHSPLSLSNLLHIKFLPCKRGQESPFYLLPWASMRSIHWGGNSNASGCHCWDFLFIRHLMSITSLSPRCPIWKVWIITFHHFTERILRPHMVLWLIQHYRTESLFKPMSLSWYMHKILIIRWLIKMIGKYTGPFQWQLYLNTES